MRSIRSRISLQSFNSRGSKGSKGSKESKRNKNIIPTGYQASTSSQVGFRDRREGSGINDSFDIDDLSQHQSHQLQTEVKGIELGQPSHAHLEGIPDNRIKVIKTIQQNDENV